MSSFVTQEMVNAFLEAAQPKWRETLAWFRHEKRVVAGLSALSAAGYVVEQGWQDIATAPRDGVAILCYAPGTPDRAAIRRTDYWWIEMGAFAHMKPVQPYTHWRPLPAPPAQEPQP